MNHHKILPLLLITTLLYLSAQAQKLPITKSNTLFTAGHAGAFIGGLYDGYYTYSKLKLHGNFGLGAPDKLDGELLILDNQIYQTQSSGKTFKVKDTELTPFAVVNFFKADTVIQATVAMGKEQLYSYLDSVLPRQNGIYAIHINGEFGTLKTRAFPPVANKPYQPLADMISLQHFFGFSTIKGDLVGYRIPAHMEGPNISGYHFHFLSADKQGGGHLIDLLTGKITIEIDYLDSFTVDLPQTHAFYNFDFKKDRRDEVKRVENGKN
ncbi:acetolactate decarboxylase [Mucilaginibacter terrae]|uniref:acetolactate decarboxylase n=1 Tax=Mucilaginibacter terrae TaxID=1955052 RepID=UPI003644F875